MKLGTLLLKLEKLLDQMVDSQDLQWGDVLALVHQHLQVHRPDAQETYVKDGSHPVFYYGPAPEKITEFYDVWRNTPAGDASMGFFAKEEDAKKLADAWNAKAGSWDKATVTKQKLRG